MKLTDGKIDLEDLPNYLRRLGGFVFWTFISSLTSSQDWTESEKRKTEIFWHLSSQISFQSRQEAS